MSVAHHGSCLCGRCCIGRAIALDMAHREELAGRASAMSESTRPSHWRPQPGTKKAIERAYGPRRKSA